MGVSTGQGLLWTRHWVVRSRIRSEGFFDGVGFRQELSKAAKPPGSNLWNSSCWKEVFVVGCRYTQGGRNSPLVTSSTHCACTVWTKNVGGGNALSFIKDALCLGCHFFYSMLSPTL